MNAPSDLPGLPPLADALAALKNAPPRRGRAGSPNSRHGVRRQRAEVEPAHDDEEHRDAGPDTDAL